MNQVVNSWRKGDLKPEGFVSLSDLGLVYNHEDPCDIRISGTYIVSQKALTEHIKALPHVHVHKRLDA